MRDQEKRSAVRVAYVSDVECEGDRVRFNARTADISTSGVFVHSKVCCDAGSILTLRFSIGSTQVEAVGEICYSMPLIGMGVRFWDLKPEYRAAIEGLVEGLGETGREDTGPLGRKVMPSGVEPVDKLLGGLYPGHLYLAHGDASGKSLFGMEFVVEGLKRGQKAGLIISYSPEDAIRRFARLGYDCLEDLYSNRLIIFKYPDDIGDQILQLRELAPVLRDLESLLAETGPERLVFDPVTKLLAGKKEELSARATEFAVWARSFGATVLLIASGDHSDAVENLMPLVKESFRFEVKESQDRVIRQIVFEKSHAIPDQSIRVDPSRGLSLLEPQSSKGPSDEQVEFNQAPPAHDSEASMPLANSVTIADQPTATDANGKSTATFSEMLDDLRTFISDLEPETGANERDAQNLKFDNLSGSPSTSV